MPPSEVQLSRARRLVFLAWAIVLSLALGIGFFGMTSLVLGWFGGDDPVLPVTEIGYGALVGIIITAGILVQVRAPERKIAGVQQAVLGILALIISAPITSDPQNLVPGIVMLAAMGILVVLHPAHRQLIRPGSEFSAPLASIAALGTIPTVGYIGVLSPLARRMAPRLNCSVEAVRPFPVPQSVRVGRDIGMGLESCELPGPA